MAFDQKAYSKEYREKNKERIKEYMKEYYEKNKESLSKQHKDYYENNIENVKEYYQKNKKHHYAVKRVYDTNNPERYHLGSIKQRARRKGLEFNLELSDIVYPEYCPVLGIKIESNLGKGGLKRNSPSVDRIDPTKGYVKGNIQIISHLANGMKQEATPEQLLKFADWIQKTYGQK